MYTKIERINIKERHFVYLFILIRADDVGEFQFRNINYSTNLFATSEKSI